MVQASFCVCSAFVTLFDWVFTSSFLKRLPSQFTCRKS